VPGLGIRSHSRTLIVQKSGSRSVHERAIAFDDSRIAASLPCRSLRAAADFGLVRTTPGSGAGQTPRKITTDAKTLILTMPGRRLPGRGIPARCRLSTWVPPRGTYVTRAEVMVIRGMATCESFTRARCARSDARFMPGSELYPRNKPARHRRSGRDPGSGTREDLHAGTIEVGMFGTSCLCLSLPRVDPRKRLSPTDRKTSKALAEMEAIREETGADLH
jgi:hypothetical protein